jgi:hypothetical protein
MAQSLPLLEHRPTVAVPAFAPGTPVSAGKLNDLAQIAGAVYPGVRGPRLLDRAKEVDARWYPMLVLSEEGDFLHCEPYGIDAAAAVAISRGGGYRVAKPPLLRKTAFHGKTRAGITYAFEADAVNVRTATNALGLSQDERIVPSYEPGDVIFATRQAGRQVITPQGQKAITTDLLDVNVDARGWATA